jgi:hypothetical protein
VCSLILQQSIINRYHWLHIILRWISHSVKLGNLVGNFYLVMPNLLNINQLIDSSNRNQLTFCSCRFQIEMLYKILQFYCTHQYQPYLLIQSYKQKSQLIQWHHYLVMLVSWDKKIQGRVEGLMVWNHRQSLLSNLKHQLLLMNFQVRDLRFLHWNILSKL